ncbi:hypothetical protein EWM64_g7921 [Hericium alpestre]|uniref:Uncharacterized protein n=1 Tax=Hericium alpestre TaxID=135208 RepID=A0A4Y9ZMR8_9AGAM|nr:hypothetical protein EWM64_g7921 [Hericium alpestre]
MLWRSSHISVLSLILWCSTRSVAQNLSDDQISLVKQRLAESATHSWEYGTRAQSLLELDASGFSVLSPVSLPPSTSLNTTANSSLSDVFAIAQNIVGNRAKSNQDATGPQPLINDSSAGDPCSIGVAVLLANWTGLGAVDGLDYAGAATDQLNFLWSDSVPKTSDGAFSHRIEQVQLCDKSANGLWKHIQLGSSVDDGHWSTGASYRTKSKADTDIIQGNAWATAGMLRVLGTMKNSQYANSFKNEIKDLTNWAFDIQRAMYPLLQSSGLFKNYADSNASNNFDDASSTAMMAATVYRMSLLTGKHTYLPDAERSRMALLSLTGSSSSSLARRQDPSQSRESSADSRASSRESTTTSAPAINAPLPSREQPVTAILAVLMFADGICSSASMIRDTPHAPGGHRRRRCAATVEVVEEANPAAARIVLLGHRRVGVDHGRDLTSPWVYGG